MNTKFEFVYFGALANVPASTKHMLKNKKNNINQQKLQITKEEKW